MIIPTVRDGALQPQDYDRTTCFEAGYLVGVNAGWRSVRPIIDAKRCTGCLQCYMHCPDGAIRKVVSDTLPSTSEGVSPSSVVFVDLDFCKGCGICARVCRFDAIAMVPESEAE